MAEARAEVRSKMLDRAFDRWELCPAFVGTMKDLLEEQEEFEDDEYEDESEPTVVPQVASINDSPIPTTWTMFTPLFSESSG
jgi:hypothetical protein